MRSVVWLGHIYSVWACIFSITVKPHKLQNKPPLTTIALKNFNLTFSHMLLLFYKHSTVQHVSIQLYTSLIIFSVLIFIFEILSSCTLSNMIALFLLNMHIFLPLQPCKQKAAFLTSLFPWKYYSSQSCMSLLIPLINFGKFVTSVAGLKYLFTNSFLMENY